MTEQATPGRPAPSGRKLRPLPQGALSLRANLSWSLAGNVVYAACQWGVLIALAKLVPEDMVGRFAYGLALAVPVFQLTNLGLRQIVATDIGRVHAFADCLGLRTLTAPAAMMLVVAIGFLGDYPRATSWVVAAVALAKGFEALSDLIYGLLQQRGRMDRVAWAMVARGAGGLPALVLAVSLTGEVLWGVVAMALVWGGVLLAHDLRSVRTVLAGAGGAEAERPTPRWDPPALRSLAWRGLPLGIAVMMLNLNTNVPRYFIEGVLGEAELGIFSALAYLMAVGATLINAMGQAAMPRLARHYQDGDRTGYMRLMGRLLGLATLIGGAGVAVAAVAGRPILGVLYAPAYAARADVFTWLMIAAALLYVETFLGYGMTACQQFRVQPFLYGAAAAVLVGLSAWLIPRSGLSGAAWAVLVGGVFRISAILVIQTRALRAMGAQHVANP